MSVPHRTHSTDRDVGELLHGIRGCCCSKGIAVIRRPTSTRTARASAAHLPIPLKKCRKSPSSI